MAVVARSRRRPLARPAKTAIKPDNLMRGAGDETMSCRCRAKDTTKKTCVTGCRTALAVQIEWSKRAGDVELAGRQAGNVQ
jgi:hypothetical protein